MTTPEDTDAVIAILEKHLQQLQVTVVGYDMPTYLRGALTAIVNRTTWAAREDIRAQLTPGYTALPWAPPVDSDKAVAAALASGTTLPDADKAAKRKLLGLDD